MTIERKGASSPTNLLQTKLFLKSQKRGIFVKQNAAFTEFIL